MLQHYYDVIGQLTPIERELLGGWTPACPMPCPPARLFMWPHGLAANHLSNVRMSIWRLLEHLTAVHARPHGLHLLPQTRQSGLGTRQAVALTGVPQLELDLVCFFS
jgi:hypothetical protein